MTEQELLDLKQRIVVAKEETAQLKGHQQALLKQLKSDWQCNNLKDVEKELQRMRDEVSVIEKKINDGTKQLEEKYLIHNNG